MNVKYWIKYSTMAGKKVFIVSALPYCNNIPHLGNIVGSTLSGDVFARYKRIMGYDVVYLCGTDEYGTTTEIKAKQENLTCRQICDKYNALHKQTYDWFNIYFDVWGRTSTDTQTRITQEIFEKLYKNGLIEEKTINQMYCDVCKMFIADRFLKGICYHKECDGKNSVSNGDQCDTCQNMIDVEKLIKPFCTICKNVPHLRDTTHLYLKLGEFDSYLKNFMIENVNMTYNAHQITKSWLDNGLESRCITRDLSWGTPVPHWIDDKLNGYKNKVFYVWWDACIGYYSILAHDPKYKDNYKEWICDKTVMFVQFQAKDNVPFHTIIFPATVSGSGNEYNSVTHLSATEYLQYEGTKFSKSNNIGVFGDQIMEISRELGITEDYWRYYLLKIRPEKRDTSFTWEEFCVNATADLVNNYGNYINRCICCIRNYYFKESNQGCVVLDFSDCQEKINTIQQYIKNYMELMDNIHLRDGMQLALDLSSYANDILYKEEPWKKYKQDQQDEEKTTIKQTLGVSLFIGYVITKLLEPFLPNSMSNILNVIHFENFDNCNIFRDDINAYNGITLVLQFDKYNLPFKPLKFADILPILDKLNLYVSKK